jgi:asparaginyl-tRNA synthetase
VAARAAPAGVLRLRAELIQAFRDFMSQEGFLLVDSPIFTPNACEGTTTLFETQYFDQKAYLTQSGQLYAEAAAMALRQGLLLRPAFRAEKSKTRRHPDRVLDDGARVGLRHASRT